MGRMNFNKANEKPNDTKLNMNKVNDTISNTWYRCKSTQVTQNTRQIELSLSLFDKKIPDKQYGSLRMWLNKEYYDGDLTDTFLSLFPEVDTINKLRGKEFMAYVEYVTSLDGENEYLRVTNVAPIE